MRWAIAAILAAGCSGNAILELEVALPAASDACGASAIGLETRIATDGACLFDQDWFDGDSAVLPLSDVPRGDNLSLIAEGADIERPLCLRLRGCADPSECPLADVTRGIRTSIEIERAFYSGEYTALAIEIDPCIEDEIAIDRCAVEGCAEGAPLDTFCEDGRHLCE